MNDAALSSPIFEPLRVGPLELPHRWRAGDRGRAGCVSCLGCFRPAGSGEGVRCVRAETDG